MAKWNVMNQKGLCIGTVLGLSRTEATTNAVSEYGGAAWTVVKQEITDVR